MEQIEHPQIEICIQAEMKSGNRESGDAYFVHVDERFALLAIADGLGNGEKAKESAVVVPAVLKEHKEESIERLLQLSNERMVHKRGAAIGIVKIDFFEKTFQYGGIGNIRMYLRRQNGTMIYPIPVPGYLSGRPIRPRVESHSYEVGDLFFMHSDGVVAKSPKECISHSRDAFTLADRVSRKMDDQDDATFMTVQLLQ